MPKRTKFDSKMIAAVDTVLVEIDQISAAASFSDFRDNTDDYDDGDIFDRFHVIDPTPVTIRPLLITPDPIPKPSPVRKPKPLHKPAILVAKPVAKPATVVKPADTVVKPVTVPSPPPDTTTVPVVADKPDTLPDKPATVFIPPPPPPPTPELAIQPPAVPDTIIEHDIDLALDEELPLDADWDDDDMMWGLDTISLEEDDLSEASTVKVIIDLADTLSHIQILRRLDTLISKDNPAESSWIV